MIKLALVTLTFFFLAVGYSSNACADSAPGVVRAAQLFDEARELMEQQDYALACAKLQQSMQLDPQLGTQLHLGHCYEKEGQLGEAYRAFLAAAELAARRNAQGIREPREKVARERAASLEARLSLLELRWLDPATEVRLTLDGAPIERGEGSSPLVVGPGEHLLRASAPGRQDWQQSFRIGAGARFGIDVPALALLPPVQQPDEQPDVMQASTKPAPLVARQGRSVRRVTGYVALGAGALGLVVGTVFGLMRNAKVHQLEDRCDFDAGRCVIANGDTAARARITALRDDAASFAKGANVAWIVGGAVAASGLVLILTAPRAETRSFAIGMTPGGLTLTAQTDLL